MDHKQDRFAWVDRSFGKELPALTEVLRDVLMGEFAQGRRVAELDGSGVRVRGA